MDLKFGRMKNLVGGEFVEAEQGEWERIIDPATGEVIAEVPRCAEEDVDRAVEAASRAFDLWFETTPRRGQRCYTGSPPSCRSTSRGWRGSSPRMWASRSPRPAGSCCTWSTDIGKRRSANFACDAFSEVHQHNPA
jgi:hypothetical protein